MNFSIVVNSVPLEDIQKHNILQQFLSLKNEAKVKKNEDEKIGDMATSILLSLDARKSETYSWVVTEYENFRNVRVESEIFEFARKHPKKPGL